MQGASTPQAWRRSARGWRRTNVRGYHNWGAHFMLALLAEAYGQAGQPEVGLRVLAEALTLVEQRRRRGGGRRSCIGSRGALRLQLRMPDSTQAEAWLPAGPGRGPPPGGEDVGAAGGGEPESSCGTSKAKVRRRTAYSPRCMDGSPKGMRRRISKQPGRCLRGYRNLERAPKFLTLNL